MNGASSLAFPDSSTLAAWRRQLSEGAVSSYRVGHLFLHRVDAPVEILERVALSPLTGFCLQVLVLQEETARDAECLLEQHLGLPPFLIAALLQELRELGLVETVHGRLLPTDLGRAARPEGKCLVRRPARRGFSFAFPEGEDRTPLFLPLPPLPSQPWNAADRPLFRHAWLEACIERDSSWKAAAGFPAEVVSLRGPRSAGDDLDWKDVLLTRTEHVFLVLIGRRDEGKDRIRGYPVDLPELRLEPAPVFDLPAAACLVSFLPSPTPEQWQLAWREWANAHGLAAHGEIRSSPHGEALVVDLPEAGAREFRRIESEIGEAWVLAGEGSLRSAARLRLPGEPT